MKILFYKNIICRNNIDNIIRLQSIIVIDFLYLKMTSGREAGLLTRNSLLKLNERKKKSLLNMTHEKLLNIRNKKHILLQKLSSEQLTM